MDEFADNLAQSRTFVVQTGEVVKYGAVDGAVDSAASAVALRPGSIIDSKYKILSLIGQGGMGAIYKVHHVLLQKDMALKTFLSHGLSQDSWQRFQREAQAIAKLKHKNIVDVFDFGIADGRLPYYTMELLDGISLADQLDKSGRLAPAEALYIFGQVAGALSHAHRQNIVHRDIKPGNIILLAGSSTKNNHRQAKLVDFGVAKLAEDTPFSNDQTLTQAGTVFGSPLYMSPEQSLGLTTDQCTDIYSFGCTLYEALTGKPPFLGETAFITMLHHQRQDAPTLKDSGVETVFPKRLEKVMAKLLAKTAAERYQDFDQVVEELALCSNALPKDSITAGQKKASPPLAPESWTKRLSLPVNAPVPSKRLVIILAGTAAALALGDLWMTGTGMFKPAPKDLSPKVTPELETLLGSRVAPKLAPVNKPYYVGLRQDADGEKRVFYFPPEEQVGTFNPQGEHKSISCTGEVSVPSHFKLVLVAGPGPFDKPELLKRFGANDLHGIQLLTQLDGDWTDQHIRDISHLTGLELLDISRADKLTAAIIKDIDKLKNLKRLNVSFTSLTGKDLISLKILPQILDLNISSLKHTDGLFPFLAGNNCCLETLIANYQNLSVQDLASIGKIKNLKVFSAVWGGIGDDGIASLQPGSKLQSIDLAHNKISDGSLQYFGRYKALQDATFSLKYFSPQGRRRLKEILPPHCALANFDEQ